MRVRTGAKVFVCMDKVGEEDANATTEKTSLTSREEERERRKGDERGGGDGVSMEDRARVVDSFGSFAVCGGSGLRGLVVGGFEKKLGMLLDACVTEMSSSEAADGIDDVIEKVALESG